WFRPHPFRFEPFWAKEESCIEVIRNLLYLCATKLKLQKVYKKLQKAYLGAISVTAWNHIRSLEKERDRFIWLEEEYRKQRSRAEWLKGGDKNTSFFSSKSLTA
ncbi:hypothetical protein PanWU01x14_152550, partial [Parasponia andersonii]